MESQYFFSKSKEDGEKDRLDLHESFFDPQTITRLESLGIQKGWDCLEVGAGKGSIARWIAKRVGPTGNVTAVDIDTKFLSGFSIDNLEVRMHDITKDDFEESRYDLIHCRALLGHLPEPEKAVKRMKDALKPNGWLYLEEQDFGYRGAVDTNYPSADVFNKLTQLFIDSAQRVANIYIGRRLRCLLDDVGFLDVKCEGWINIIRGGELFSLLEEKMYQVFAPTMIAAGSITEEQVETVTNLLHDPKFYFLGPTQFNAFGKRS